MYPWREVVDSLVRSWAHMGELLLPCRHRRTCVCLAETSRAAVTGRCRCRWMMGDSGGLEDGLREVCRGAVEYGG